MKISISSSDAAILKELGTRMARARLELNLTQAQLAEEAGVSKRTVERLESGSVATQLSGFLRVCRVLGLVERLEAFVPEPAPSPIEQMKLQGRRRRRASVRRTEKRSPSGTPSPSGAPSPRKWTWGDEK